MTEGGPPEPGSWLQRRGVDVAVWCLVIVGVVAAAAGIAWLLSQVRVELRPVLPPRTREAPLPVAVEPPPAPASKPLSKMVDATLPDGSVIMNPRWRVQPAPEFPAEAMRWGAGEGAVTLVCRVETSGRLSACQVVEETPAGHGFAASALEATSGARLEPRRVDGVAVEARVRFTIRYRLG